MMSPFNQETPLFCFEVLTYAVTQPRRNRKLLDSRAHRIVLCVTFAREVRAFTVCALECHGNHVERIASPPPDLSDR